METITIWQFMVLMFWTLLPLWIVGFVCWIIVLIDWIARHVKKKEHLVTGQEGKHIQPQTKSLDGILRVRPSSGLPQNPPEHHRGKLRYLFSHIPH